MWNFNNSADTNVTDVWGKWPEVAKIRPAPRVYRTSHLQAPQAELGFLDISQSLCSPSCPFCPSLFLVLNLFRPFLLSVNNLEENELLIMCMGKKKQWKWQIFNVKRVQCSHIGDLRPPFIIAVPKQGVTVQGSLGLEG